MQKKKIIWLFNNLDKYQFANAQALAFKEEFSKLLITESTLENDDIFAKALNCYDKFANNFYNNILGYQNGLANKVITAGELDCYFVIFGGDLIPIGCFRNERPVEAVSVVQTYLGQCRESVVEEKNQLISKWQKAIVELSGRYAQIKDSKNPSKSKAIALIALSALNILMVIFALIACLADVDLPGEISEIPVLIITLAVLGFSVWPILGILKEFKLLSQKEVASSVINTLGNDVGRIEHVLNQSFSQNYEVICSACRRGENIAVNKNTNAQLIAQINTNIRVTYEFLKKSEAERTGINIVAIILSAIIAVVIPVVCFTPVIPAISDVMSVERNYPSDEDDDDTDNGNGISEDEDDEDDEDVVINEIDTSAINEIISDNTSYTSFGIYVKNLENGYEYGYNEDSEFLASAMAQIVILDTLGNVVDDNNVDIDDETLLFTYLPNGKEAPGSPSQDGQYLTLKECIEDVAVYGDNNKSNHLVDYIAQMTGNSNGFDYINSLMRENGYYGTKTNRKTFVNPDYVDYSVEANATTPREIANIFADLIGNDAIGSEAYIKGIFKSVGGNGEPIGLKKFVSASYDVCNVNALTGRSTNNVAMIERDGKQLIVAILSSTDEDKTSVETDIERSKAQDKLIDYILETQFEY